jgi:glycosyltransferase involved in cell wall biosynthesis
MLANNMGNLNRKNKSKVLHIVESLDRGAVENWLMRMLRHARKKGMDVDWTFYCVLGRPGAMDDEARALGARVVHSPVPRKRKLAFIRALRNQMQSEKYDALHCHHDLTNAVYLLASIGVPIRRRIVHLHNADESLPTPSCLKQGLLREPMRRICLTLADKIVGISNCTLDTFLAGRLRRPNRDIVHTYGVDPTLFVNIIVDRANFRRQ